MYPNKSEYYQRQTHIRQVAFWKYYSITLLTLHALNNQGNITNTCTVAVTSLIHDIHVHVHVAVHYRYFHYNIRFVWF